MMDNREYYAKLNDVLSSHEALWQATVVASDGSTPAKPGMKLAIPINGAVFGNLGGGEMEHRVIEIVQQDKPAQAQLYSFNLSDGGAKADYVTSMICGGQVSVFIEALHLARQLFIIGSGHCGKALGHLAKLAGFYVCLIDNRKEIIDDDLSQYGHRAVLHDYSNLAEVIEFGASTYVVIMTHGHLHDREVLQQCLRQETAYLGMIGSKTKVAQTFATLRQQGYSDSELEKCNAPIGLAIGSQTPYEIAVSIMAQIIAHKNRDRKPNTV